MISWEFHIFEESDSTGKYLIFSTIVDIAISSELHWVKLGKHSLEWSIVWYNRDYSSQNTSSDTTWIGFGIGN